MLHWQKLFSQLKASPTWNSILFTRNNQVWLNSARVLNGIFVFDNTTTTNPSAKFYDSFTDQDGQAFSPWKILCMTEDLDGTVWIGTNLGNANDIRFVVVKTETVNGKVKTTEANCSLSELGVSPLTYFYLSSNITVFVKYLELIFRKKNRLFSQKLAIDYKKRTATWGSEIKTLFENEWTLNNLRSILANSRALSAEDFSTSSTHTAEINLKGIDKAELGNRYQVLYSYCKKLNTDFNHLLLIKSAQEKVPVQTKLWTEDELLEVIDLLIQSASIGVTNALTSIPSTIFESKIEEEQLKMQSSLLTTVQMVYKALSIKIRNAEVAVTELDTNDEDAVVSAYTKAIQEILYANFKVIPQFNLKPLSNQDFAAQLEQLKDGFSYQNVQSLDMETWTSEVSKVREPMSQWNQIRMFSDFTGIPQGETAILQFPFNPEKDKEWLGREVSSEDLMDDKESLVLYNKGDFSSNASELNAGIVIDQWMEFLPYEKQRGGIVFNFDQPNAEAPQVILLAVPSKIIMRKRKDQTIEAKNWTLDDLIVTLNDTRLMAENRAVEPDHLYAETELAKVIPLLKYDKGSIA